MARILKKNKYELAVGSVKRLSKLTNPDERILELEHNKMAAALKLQNKNIVLGGLHRIKYAKYENDPFPLALVLSEPRADIGCIAAINLHYLHELHAMALMRALKFRNAPIIKRGKVPIVLYEMIKDIHIPYKAYRLYKVEAIKPLEYIPVAEWSNTVKEENSKWKSKFY